MMAFMFVCLYCKGQLVEGFLFIYLLFSFVSNLLIILKIPSWKQKWFFSKLETVVAAWSF